MIIRLSALGDVLMTVPVIDALAAQYPGLDITFVSRPAVGGIFAKLPSNVHFVGLTLETFRQRYDIPALFRQLRKYGPSVVCDFHNVLRTRAVGALFRVSGVKVVRLEKDRRERRNFLRTRPLKQRRSVFESYADVLARAGYPVVLDPAMPLSFARPSSARSGVGVAPFAAHCGKIYPLDKMESIVAALSASRKVYLFGAGPEEKAVLSAWQSKYPGVTDMTGVLGSLAAEMDFISGLELMVTMDSANMHLASLAGTRVVSIWGATHPWTGFLGWNQSPDDCIQLDMPCRPCSIYGNRKCECGGYPCLNGLDAGNVADIICRKAGVCLNSQPLNQTVQNV